MLLLHLVRPKFKVQGFLAVFAGIAGWILVFLARSETPQVILLLEWQPSTLFTLSPSLLIDHSSWNFALALASLLLTIMIASIAQLGRSPRVIQEETHEIQASVDESGLIESGYQPVQPITKLFGSMQPPDWLIWAAMLVFTAVGILAVTAGNILTLLIAWATLDIIELVILLGQTTYSRTRERIILAFAARMAGICIVLIAGVFLWSQGAPLMFNAITQPVSTILIVAAGLRLGVLPLHLPFTKGLPVGRTFGTALHLVPAISNYILLVRVSGVGVIGPITVYLLGLTLLAGIYAGVNWLRAKDEIEGRLYWLLAASSLVVASAILQFPVACLIWSITCLLSGGLIFSLSLRHKNLLPLVLLGAFALSSLPFTPAWQGMAFFQFSSSQGISLSLFTVFSLLMLVIQAFLLAGFIRHALRGISPVIEASPEHVERWVWFLYPMGLVFIVATHFLIGWLMLPNLQDVPLSGWLMGPVILIITAFIIYITWRPLRIFHPTLDPGVRSAWDRLFSFDWLYRVLWVIFRTLTRVFALVSSILEGDGGLLWALVLFGLIFVFLQR